VTTPESRKKKQVPDYYKPEAIVKKQVKDFLKARGVSSLTSPVNNPRGFYHMVVPMGKGSPFLDFTICYRGSFGVLETKAEGKEPTERQYLIMRMIHQGGGKSMWGDTAELCIAQLTQWFSDVDLDLPTWWTCLPGGPLR
jgi:hypothetical protein